MVKLQAIPEKLYPLGEKVTEKIPSNLFHRMSKKLNVNVLCTVVSRSLFLVGYLVVFTFNFRLRPNKKRESPRLTMIRCNTSSTSGANHYMLFLRIHHDCTSIAMLVFLVFQMPRRAGITFSDTYHTELPSHSFCMPVFFHDVSVNFCPTDVCIQISVDRALDESYSQLRRLWVIGYTLILLLVILPVITEHKPDVC